MAREEWGMKGLLMYLPDESNSKSKSKSKASKEALMQDERGKQEQTTEGDSGLFNFVPESRSIIT